MKRIIFFLGLFFLTICSFGQTLVTSGDINLRSTPEVKENKICLIPKGTVVTIVQDTVKYAKWKKVNFNEKIGYVYFEFLKNVPSNSNDNNLNKGVKHYKNSQGEEVQSPTYYNSAPDGATAECNDGTYSFSRNHRGTCSHHGGVKRGFK